MFTKVGKSIISKYLLGQTPAYASYIAIGCGAKPGSTDPIETTDFSLKSLDFETARAKIISRGYVTENGTSNMVLTAEIPTDERYAITEIGIYPAEMNDAAGTIDSKNLLKFTTVENWNKDDTTKIILNETKLDGTLSNILQSDAWFINSDDVGLNGSTYRTSRLEVPRFLTQSLILKSSSTSFISLSGLNIDLSKNIANDQLKLAYSVISNSELNDTNPSSIKIHIKLHSGVNGYYLWNIEDKTVNNVLVPAQNYSKYGRYQVSTISISDLVIGNGTPSLSNITKIEISVENGSSDYWIAFDGMRLEAVNEYTSTYDLVAYKVISDSIPIIKNPNNASFIEFRFNVDVGA